MLANTISTSLLYEQLARLGKSVSSPHRIAILDLLAQGERTVEQLADELGLTLKNASAHLRVLRTACLVETRQEAQFRVYRLADEEVASLVVTLRALAERRLAEVREFTRECLSGSERLTAVDRRRLLNRIRKGDVIVVDVRAPEEFDAAHIPGAQSIPLAELDRALRTLPKDREIVAYCRGAYCGLSQEAVALLRRNGFRASRLPDGVGDWTTSGLPVERAPSRQQRAGSRGRPTGSRGRSA